MVFQFWVVIECCYLLGVVKNIVIWIVLNKNVVIWFVFYKLYTKVDVLIYEFANNINMPYTIFYNIKVTGQFVCYTENLLTRETSREHPKHT
jgi:hypothetical protein